MEKALLIVVILCYIFIPALHAEEPIQIPNTGTYYTLPYPGILPSHPLYFVKELRDRLYLLTQRDIGNKAEALFHLADKHASVAQKLSEEGREEEMIEEIKKSTDYFSQGVESFEEMNELGQKVDREVLDKTRLSSKKHYEVVTSMMKNASQDRMNTLKNLLDQNIENYNKLEKIS